MRMELKGLINEIDISANKSNTLIRKYIFSVSYYLLNYKLVLLKTLFFDNNIHFVQLCGGI